jgi:hypothetical protein
MLSLGKVLLGALRQTPKLCPIINLVTYLESTLVEVFILNNLNFFRMNTYEKRGEGTWLLLTSPDPNPASTCLLCDLQGSHHQETFDSSLPAGFSAALVSAHHFPYPIKVVTATVALWCNG